MFSAHSYLGEWLKVDHCTGITNTNCDLTSFIQDYSLGYKVKVQLAAGKTASAWIKKKFVPNLSKCFVKSVPKTPKLRLGGASLFIILSPITYLAGKLRPPTFTLRPTSSSLTVHVHQKPILLKLFPFGTIYTVYLEQRGEDNQVIINKDVWGQKIQIKNLTSPRGCSGVVPDGADGCSLA